MSEETNILDMVAGYRAYASVSELSVQAGAEAPATTIPCSVASSTYCSAAASAVGGATYRVGC